MENWTTIAVSKDTHKVIGGCKQIKRNGGEDSKTRLENFNDVIRRVFGLQPEE